MFRSDPSKNARLLSLRFPLRHHREQPGEVNGFKPEFFSKAATKSLSFELSDNPTHHLPELPDDLFVPVFNFSRTLSSINFLMSCSPDELDILTMWLMASNKVSTMQVYLNTPRTLSTTVLSLLGETCPSFRSPESQAPKRHRQR
jgi:hypothetical protein